MSRRFRIIALLANTGLLVLIFFAPLAFTDFILARGDTFIYFYPYWDARDAALALGELPLWTNDIFMGAPLLANPQLGTLYPPNWLTIALPAPDAVRISILLHVAWALLGAYRLARRTLKLVFVPALIAGSVYAFGGYLGGHVEQINQLQGWAWFPWLLMLFDLAIERPRTYVPLLGIAWALQLLSGHTQTAFISGVGLGIYALFRRMPESWYPATIQVRQVVRRLMWLSVAVVIAVILALPQLVPTQELIAQSNRGDGLNSQEATAFSLNPFLAGRSLLPSYDAQPFSEYIGYIGIIGIGLAIVGATTDDNRRRVWIALVVIGLFLAFGRANPLYLPLTNVPGFDLFRVPARWLALSAMGASMLVGMGAQALLRRGKLPFRKVTMLTLVVVLSLAGASLLSGQAAGEIDGPPIPTFTTFFAWGIALAAVIGLFWLKTVNSTTSVLVLVLVVGELYFAAQNLPYNYVTDAAVYRDSRFTTSQMQAFIADETPPGRLLSISDLRFDPGDRDALERRWELFRFSERGARYAFTATKLQETIAPNLSLTWGVPSIDGFGGGILPTSNYIAFSSLLLPDEGALRPVDGRLREVLALPECRGACIPDDRWLDLMNVRYLLTDKVFDLTTEGIFYDTQFLTPLAAGETITVNVPPDFQSDTVHLLCVEACQPDVQFNIAGDTVALNPLDDEAPLLDGLHLLRVQAEPIVTPDAITITATADTQIRAITLVDSRTDVFAQLTPPGWERAFSGDVKIYENLDVLPRAFIVHEALSVPDTYDGREQALSLMAEPDFDPRQTVIISGRAEGLATDEASDAESSVRMIEYSDNRMVLNVDTDTEGYLVLTDAFYPGWRAEINGVELPIRKANGMFRAVWVPEGNNLVEFVYRPAWLIITRGGVLVWGLFLVGVIVVWQVRGAAVNEADLRPPTEIKDKS